MKKAKMMLAAVAVVALVGGALAFKAAKFNSVFVYTLNAQGNECHALTSNFKTTTGEGTDYTVFITNSQPTSTTLTTATSVCTDQVKLTIEE